MKKFQSYKDIFPCFFSVNTQPGLFYICSQVCQNRSAGAVRKELKFSYDEVMNTLAHITQIKEVCTTSKDSSCLYIHIQSNAFVTFFSCRDLECSVLLKLHKKMDLV